MKSGLHAQVNIHNGSSTPIVVIEIVMVSNNFILVTYDTPINYCNHQYH